jgi:subtilase family serine protease
MDGGDDLRQATGLMVFAAATLLTACGQSAGSVLPMTGSDLTPSTLRAVPIPATSPTPPPGLLGGLLNLVGGLTCGVSLGVTCHILPGAGPQGLAAGTPVQKLPGLHPDDLRAAYNLPSTSAGTGQTIGIVVAFDNPNVEADLGVYRAKFGLPACTTANGCFTKLGPGLLGAVVSGNQGWGQETSLDVDVASAVCPNCKIIVVESPSDSPAALLAAARLAVANGATVVSNSYSLKEYAAEAADDAAYAIGVPFVVGAGDSGAGAQWPAASSHAIAVGGTSLARDHSARGWSERPWSMSGGGCSAYIAKPAWQPNDGCAGRSANDVAAFADPNPGVSVYDSYLSHGAGWRTYGGTSVAAPIVAGAIALAGNGTTALLDAGYIYAHAGALNPIGGGYNAIGGNGSPNGVAAF